MISDCGIPVFYCPGCDEFMELRFMKTDIGLFELLKKGEENAKVSRVRKGNDGDCQQKGRGSNHETHNSQS